MPPLRLEQHGNPVQSLGPPMRSVPACSPLRRSTRFVALADPIELRLTTGGVLLRHQAHPRSELSSLAKAAPLPIEATIAVATSGPMPGISRSRRQAASLEAIRSTSSFIS